ncbi:MAG TPA: hypothetical protein VIF09_00135 [Polyangiaceae bacterium]
MRLLVALGIAAALAWSPGAHAEPQSEVQAHAAYERGTAAFRRGDFATAAREYSAADALAPNPVALQAAIDATVQADDPILGEQLLDRARATARVDSLVASMLAAERKFAHRTGRIVLACPAPPCLAAIDGVATPPGVPAVVRVGSHTITLEASGGVTTRVVTVGPDETETIAPGAAPAPAPAPAPASAPAPAPAPSPAPSPPRPGLSPVFFWLASGATVVAGGLTLASGVDTANRHSTFEGTCGTDAPGCSHLSADGKSAQLRTNVLLGVTAALGAATLVTAVLVRWHGASLSAGPASLAFDARF